MNKISGKILEISNIINKSTILPIYIHPIGAVTKNQKGLELSEIGEMVKAGAVAVSDDGIPISNSQICFHRSGWYS